VVPFGAGATVLANEGGATVPGRTAMVADVGAQVLGPFQCGVDAG
jgi:hypothetical protein